MSNRLAPVDILRDTPAMDTAAHYRRLIALGREEFLAAAAGTVLVRFHGDPPTGPSTEQTLTIEISQGLGGLEDEAASAPPSSPAELEIFPLVKKAGASFPDRITIGRTSNNDIVIADQSISRFHAYLKNQGGAGWVVADAGSKNGTWLRGTPLEARKERRIPSRARLRLGDVDLTLYTAADLYSVLGGVS
jgi:hypothetical protein